jgi:DNA-binding NtrC family response regulator
MLVNGRFLDSLVRTGLRTSYISCETMLLYSLGMTGTDPDAYRIMIVEPDILARLVLADYLRECGYKVVEGSCAEDVFLVLRSDIKVHLVFAEVRLSGASDGFALAKQTRELFPDVDVLLTSGVANAADKAGDLCAESVLQKPYHADDVLRRINMLRDHRRQGGS